MTGREIKPTQSQRIDALEKRLAQIETEAAEARQSAQETHDMVRQLSDAFLKPQPGHERNLLDRLGAVVIKAERGSWGLTLVFWLAGGIATIGAAWQLFRGEGG